MNSQYTRFLLQRGKHRQTIEKRFRDFDVLRNQILDHLNREPVEKSTVAVNKEEFLRLPELTSVNIPALPPKTLWSVANDQPYLIERQAKLFTFLEEVLSLFSSHRRVEQSPLREFLSL